MADTQDFVMNQTMLRIKDPAKSGSVRAFIHEADDMLREFVDLILTVSRESMGMVAKVEDVSRHCPNGGPNR